MKSNRLLIAVVVAMLSSPGAVAGQQLFGMSPVPLPLGGSTPVAINPTNGTVTGLTPGTSFTGSLFDVVSLADTLYFVSSTNPTLPFSVNETTGVQNFIFLNAPVTDMTAGVTGASTVPIPGALPLFATGLGALGLLGWRRKKKAAA